MAIRTEEYLVAMPDIARLKRHHKVLALLEVVPNHDQEQWKSIRDLLVAPEEEASLRIAYPKSLQSALAQRWSFGGLVSELAKTGALHGAQGLLHDYAMGSHLVHQDGDAMLTMWDRERRSPERIAAIELAHAAKVLATLTAYARVRAASVFRAKQVDPAPIVALDQALEPLENEFRSAHEAWVRIEYGDLP